MPFTKIIEASIKDDAVTSAKIVAGAVVASDVADGSITTAKLAADAVTDAKIADDVVGSEHLTAGEVDTTALGADSVTAAKIADDAVDSEHMAAGSVDNAHLAGSIATSKIGSGTFADARISESSVTQHVTAFDDTALRQDITALALHSAVADNKTAHNLPNSFIEQFQDDTGIGTETDCNRNASEFMETEASVASTTAFNFRGSGTHDNPELLGCNSYNTQSSMSHSYAWTNDRIAEGTGSPNNCAGIADFAFDLSQDFEHYVRLQSSSDGNVHNASYHAYTGVIVRDTSATFGKHPTLSSASVFDTGDSTGNMYGLMDNTGLAQVFSSAYATAVGLSNFTNNYSVGESTQSYDISSDHADGSIIGKYYNSGTYVNYPYGTRVLHDASANQMTIHFLSAKSNTSILSSTAVTVTNVPSTGTFFFVSGRAASTSNRYLSLSVNTDLASSNGTVSTTTLDTNATGTLISNASVASAAQTKVSGVMLYKDGAGTATIGTDLKIYFSCDNGSNWTEAASYGTVSPVFSTGVKMIRLGDTTCTSGTQVKYKAVWANQVASSKETQLHGIGMNY
jgi:hypothetical protein